MPPELVYQAARLAVLAVLWLMVFAAVRVVRADVFGPKVPDARVPAEPIAVGERPARRRRAIARRLVVVTGDRERDVIELGTSIVTIGRAKGCTLVLDDEHASSRHAQLRPTDNGWLLEDLGSTNGTWLAGTRIDGAVPVAAGVSFRIGDTELQVRK